MDFHRCEEWGSGCALWNASVICICLLVLLGETSVRFEVESRVESVDFTAPSPHDLALTCTKVWASFKCCHILVVFPTYEKSCEKSLQHTLFLFFLSGSINFPSLARNPKCYQTALVTLSNYNNLQSLVVLWHSLVSFCSNAIFN